MYSTYNESKSMEWENKNVSNSTVSNDNKMINSMSSNHPNHEYQFTYTVSKLDWIILFIIACIQRSCLEADSLSIMINVLVTLICLISVKSFLTFFFTRIPLPLLFFSLLFSRSSSYVIKSLLMRKFYVYLSKVLHQQPSGKRWSTTNITDDWSPVISTSSSRLTW